MSLKPSKTDKLPILPGTSPFRVKGHVYRGVLEHLETLIPGGCAAIRAELRDDDLRSFFEQSFLPSGWYDVLPWQPLVVTAARIFGMPLLQLTRELARVQATRDIHGIYRFVLKVASADVAVSRLPRVTAQYFDFGTLELKSIEPGHATFERTGVPTPMAAFYCGITEGFFAVALELAGASEVRVRPGRGGQDGSRAGIETMSIPFDVRWQG